MSKTTTETGQRSTMYLFDPMDIAIIGGLDLPEAERGPLDTATDKANALYDERLKLKLTPEWIANIEAFGVKETINVAKLAGVLYVVNGRQRLRAARVANAARTAKGVPPLKVPCLLTRTDDVGLLREMVVTNLHQEDSTATKIAKLKRLLDRGVSVEDAATIFAVKPGTAKAWLAYDDNAVAAVKSAVNAGKVPSTTGADLARLPTDKQEGALEAILHTATKESSTAPKRGGKASKARRIIKSTANPNQSPGIADKKTLKSFLEAVESTAHSANASDKTLAWWSGVESALQLVLGIDGADKRLVEILNGLDA